MNLKYFYDSIRSSITLTNENVRGFDLIILEGSDRKVPLNDLAYILATAYHETASRMQPIAEYGRGKGRKYGVVGKYGQVPYGRGYVQLTWDYNYEKADKKLGLNGALLRNFDKALEPKIAVQILFKGMEEGWFTTKKLRDYIDLVDDPDDKDFLEYKNARRIINGTDKQDLIARYALIFERGLKAAQYGLKQPQLPQDKPKDDPGVIVPEKGKGPQSLFKSILSLILKILKGLK